MSYVHTFLLENYEELARTKTCRGHRIVQPLQDQDVLVSPPKAIVWGPSGQRILSYSEDSKPFALLRLSAGG